MKALYTAATGMTAQQMRIENISNNLANVSTVGFKKSRANFEDLLYQNLSTGSVSQQQTRVSSLQSGSGVRMGSLVKEFTMGDITSTNNTYDFAIAGRGFFVVQMPDGTETYTRNGQFGVNAEGELVTQSGLVVSPGIEILRDVQTVQATEDGTLQAVYKGDPNPITIGQLRVVDFMNPSGLQALGGNLFIASPESGLPLIMDSMDGLRVQQGFLESSNVDVAEELVNMIVAQRAFEMTSKAVESSDQMMQTVNALKR
jgi:flagellar basal-body rod protein FlgG